MRFMAKARPRTWTQCRRSGHRDDFRSGRLRFGCNERTANRHQAGMSWGDATQMGLPFNPEYGLVAVFCMVLVQQLGAPLPVLPLMLFAGAQSARDPLYGVYALALAIVASTLGSLPWYLAGQRFGHRVLKFTCRVSLSRDTCVRQTETVFERHGAVTLLISKFVPGLAHVAPPLAGAFGIRMPRFLFFNAVGAVLWAGAGLILGLLFYAEINSLLGQFVAFGGHALAALALLVATYVAYRWIVRRRFLKSLQASRIEVAELQEMIGRGDAPIVLDVRSRRSPPTATSSCIAPARMTQLRSRSRCCSSSAAYAMCARWPGESTPGP